MPAEPNEVVLTQDILSELKKLNEALANDMDREQHEKQEAEKVAEQEKQVAAEAKKLENEKAIVQDKELQEFHQKVVEAIERLEEGQQSNNEMVNKLEALTIAVQTTEQDKENADIQRNTNLLLSFSLLALIPMFITVRFKYILCKLNSKNELTIFAYKIPS